MLRTIEQEIENGVVHCYDVSPGDDIPDRFINKLVIDGRRNRNSKRLLLAIKLRLEINGDDGYKTELKKGREQWFIAFRGKR